MISLQTLHRGNATKAGHYYADQKDDYYSRDGNSARWQGQGAELLGLTGEVTHRQFVAAFRGDFGPAMTLANTVRKDAKSRAAIDLTFSAPKSISIQALVGKDGTVLAAHDHAVTRTLEYLERELMRARQKEDGESRTEKTDNAIMAKFRHETARPSEYDHADPQLHTHTLIMNATRRADGAWVAMANEQIYKNKMMLDTIYKSEMAAYLEKAGYALRYEKDGFELANISREQIERFSKRGMTVEAELAKIGKTRKTASREQKQTITLATRNAKRPEITRSMLQTEWQQQANELGIDFAAAREQAQREHTPGKPSKQKPEHERPSPDGANPGFYAGKADPTPVSQQLRQRTADQCVAWAIRHIAEREAVMTESELKATALKHAMGTGVSYWEIAKAIEHAVQTGHLVRGAPVYRMDLDTESPELRSKQGWVDKMVREGATVGQARRNVRRAIASGGLVLADVHYTTQAAREREKRILQIERDGRGQVASILSSEQVQQALREKSLKPGQLAAAELVLTTTNRVVGVQGLAGVGKSYMLQHVKEAMESANYTVKSVAPYGSQVKELRRLGVEAVTVASMLEAQQNRFTLDNNTVLVIDEGAVVPARQMEKILQRAEKAGARVMMMGDKDQTKAIEAGRPMHQLQDEGMQTAVMGDIVRQTNLVLRDAVNLAAQGHASQALHILQTKLNSVEEITDADMRYGQIADHYATLEADQQRRTLIVTGTNVSRKTINELVHTKLGLAGKGFTYSLLTRVDTTQAQRRIAKYYQVGNIIQPERSYRCGLNQDALYEVIAVDNQRNRITVRELVSGTQIEFNPSRAAKLSVYERIKAELSAGDAVRITRNNAKLDLVNGERYSVLGVTPTTITLGKLDDNGEVTRRVSLPATERIPVHMDYAYASTVHSAQGLSETGVILNQETFSRTTKSDVFYVAISRAREWVKLYTDDMTKLPFAVDRREEKGAALDIGIAHRPTDVEKHQKHAPDKTMANSL